MLRKTKVLFGDNESNWGEMCASMLDSDQYDTQILNREAPLILKAIHMHRPDIIILETYMNLITSLGFMEIVKYIPDYDPKFIIINSHGNMEAKKLALSSGASFYLLKPFGFDLVCDCLTQLTTQNTCPAQDYTQVQSIEQIVSIALLELKISPNLKGYQYLRFAIMLAYENFSIMDSMTKKLYPSIATKFCTNTLSVERAMRNAISSSWERLETEVIDRYLSGINKKPSNARYIATIVECLRLTQAVTQNKYA